MEQLIEFPLTTYDTGNTTLMLPENVQGYCICYQYDVNEYGYGPYGFRTQVAKDLLGQIFEPLAYWDDTNGKMVDIKTPGGGGLYFFKGQPQVSELIEEVSAYQKAASRQALRSRYAKPTISEQIAKEPLLCNAYEGGKVRDAVISKLLIDGCKFFSIYYDIGLGQETFIFFDPAIRERIKEYCIDNNINYLTFSSVHELNAW